MRQAWWMVCSVVLMVISVGQVGWAQPAYRAEPLAIFGVAINDAGTIAGARTGRQGTTQAAVQFADGTVKGLMAEQAGVSTVGVDVVPGPAVLIAWFTESETRAYVYVDKTKQLMRLRPLPGAVS